MTATDPRLAEIRARVDALTQDTTREGQTND